MDEFKAKRFIFGEGTTEIQKLVISRNILKGLSLRNILFDNYIN